MSKISLLLITTNSSKVCVVRKIHEKAHFVEFYVRDIQLLKLIMKVSAELQKYYLNTLDQSKAFRSASL